MATNTPRLGFYMPADDGSEPINVATDLNDNLEKLDSSVGFVPSTSVTPPVAPFDGMATYETDTGKAKIRASGAWKYLLSAAASFASHVSLDSAYRFAIGTLAPTALIDLIVSNITTVPVLKAKQASEAFNRVQLDNDGIRFGSGATAPDTRIYRQGTANLNITGSVNMESTLDVAGAASVGSLNVDGDLNLDGDLVGDFNITGSFQGTGINVPKIIRKTTDTGRSATTSAANDPELFVTLAANSTYLIEAFILYGGDTAADFKCSWTGLSGLSGLRSVIGQGIGATSRDEATVRIGAYASTTDASFGATTTTNFNAVHEKLVLNTVDGGIMYFRWAQATSNAAVTTVKAGSYIELRKLA